MSSTRHGPDARAVGEVIASGMTLLELLFATSLTLLLVAALAPAWLSFQATTIGTTDHVVSLLQSRVALARLERDLRLATAEDESTSACSAMVEADANQFVVLTRSGADMTRELVEWEFTGGTMMRRRVPWSGGPPSTVTHSLFSDNKTMLEGVQPGATFRYLDRGKSVLGQTGPVDRTLIESVRISAFLRPPASPRAKAVPWSADISVGR
jgi:type II secretory pathway pseudopilin PulG